ncbi:MAG: hypothetical protein QOE89_172 [Pseudonocardiales bacterium]|nr:hypothetical protein [Pseudonocardiales bacterium]
MVAAACTKAPPPGATGSTVVTSATGSASSSAPNSASSGSAGPTTAPTSATGSAASTTPTPARSAPAAAGPPACTTGALTIEVQRGSGAAGHQFASLVFTNASQTACSITGFPGVALLIAGAPLGRPATRSGQSIKRIDLKPGSKGTASLTNDSTCNAENSDSVQIIVPNQTEKVVRPLRFRGCTMTINPVAAA